MYVRTKQAARVPCDTVDMLGGIERPRETEEQLWLANRVSDKG